MASYESSDAIEVVGTQVLTGPNHETESDVIAGLFSELGLRYWLRVDSSVHDRTWLDAWFAVEHSLSGTRDEQRWRVPLVQLTSQYGENWWMRWRWDDARNFVTFPGMYKFQPFFVVRNEFDTGESEFAVAEPHFFYIE